MSAPRSAGLRLSESQTLITGVYRTGTEFVTQLLNCHPAICAEMYRVNVLRFVHGRYDPFQARANQERAVKDLAERLQERYQLVLDQGAILDELGRRSPADYGVFYDIVMSWLYLREPARHWAEKNQLLWREIPLFLKMMSNGKAILVQRDPRSVLLSFKKYTYAAPPAYLGAVFNCLDSMLHGLELAERLPKDRFLSIRYEDAAAAPQETARRMWSFLGLKGDHDVSDRTSWRDAYGRPWHANSSFHKNDDAKAFDVRASIERWREGLSPAELSLVEGVCGDVMERHGYKRTLSQPDWPSAMRLFAADDAVTQHFRHWLISGRGLQAFPTDPVKKENWAKE